MANTTHTILKDDFSGGELSPQHLGRISVPEYKAGSSLMYNFLPMGQAGMRRRPSTRYIATLGFDSNACQAVPYTATYGQKFLLLIGRVATVPTIFVYSLATHAVVGS